MLKFNPLSAALLCALCSDAFAQNASVTQDVPDTEAQLSAGAVPAPVTSVATLIKASASTSEARARSVQGWLNQISTPYAN